MQGEASRGNKKSEPLGSLFQDVQEYYLLLKRHQRQPGSGAIKIVAKKVGIGLLHIGSYFTIVKKCVNINRINTL
jgi:hypothetical protein